MLESAVDEVYKPRCWFSWNMRFVGLFAWVGCNRKVT
jgi:hypothetical protein